MRAKLLCGVLLAATAVFGQAVGERFQVRVPGPRPGMEGPGGFGMVGGQRVSSCGVHSVPWVMSWKFAGPAMEALRSGSRFSPIPQFLKLGIVTSPVNGPPVGRV